LVFSIDLQGLVGKIVGLAAAEYRLRSTIRQVIRALGDGTSSATGEIARNG
jgi:hypothetical protein